MVPAAVCILCAQLDATCTNGVQTSMYTCFGVRGEISSFEQWTGSIEGE